MISDEKSSKNSSPPKVSDASGSGTDIKSEDDVDRVALIRRRAVALGLRVQEGAERRPERAGGR